MPELPKLSDFPCQTFDKLRFGDTDALGHINNAVFITLLETGRIATLNMVQPKDMKQVPTFVIARIALDLRAEIFWPGTVEIGSGVTAIGNSSISFTQALFQKEKCVATAQSVLVHFDRAAHRAAPLTEEMRAAVAAVMMKQ